MKSGNIGPTGERLPEPDLLLLSYTGCFTFMKWFELLREEYHCPIGDAPRALSGRRAHHRRRCATTSSSSSRTKVIPALEQVTGQARTTRTGCRSCLRARRRPRTTSSRCSVGQARARRRSTPTSARVYYVGPDLHRVPRHRGRRSTTTARCARRSRSACAQGIGPGHARRRARATSGTASSSKGRRTGPLPRVLEDVRRRGRGRRGLHLHEGRRRLRPRLPPRSRATRSRRSPTTASAATRTSTCRTRVDMLARYVEEYEADGFLINSVKSCNSFTAGQLHDPARGREAHRPARRLHRERPRRPALLLGRQHQEPPRVLLPDARAEARREARA